MSKKLTVRFTRKHYLGEKYFSFISPKQFFEYFLPSDYEYQIVESDSDITILDERTESSIDSKSFNILISVENAPHWPWYPHYNKYKSYGNPDVDVYFYNHISRLEQTDRYLAIPTISTYMNYYESNKANYQSKIKFVDKKYCLVINKSGLNSHIDESKNLLSQFGTVDHISQYNDLILNKSCYHSQELIDVFSKYKFIICFENSYADGYVTEKIFNCFFAHTIPIYMGAPDISNHINPNSFIDRRKADWLEEVRRLNSNEVAYNQIIHTNKISTTYNDSDYQTKLSEVFAKRFADKDTQYSYVDKSVQSIQSIKYVKKIISFCLWGKHEFYNYGAYENAVLAQSIYPDWVCRFYYSNTDSRIIKLLESMSNVELIKIDKIEHNYSNMFWRFIPAFMEKDIIMIVRDTDSRLNMREKLAVDEWLNTESDFHIMRDHIWHGTRILGGMWGVRNNLLLGLEKEFLTYQRVNQKGNDQKFLQDTIYNFVKHTALIHDTYNLYADEKCLKFKSVESYNSYCGAYCLSAPNTFRALGEPNRLLSFTSELENTNLNLTYRY